MSFLPVHADQFLYSGNYDQIREIDHNVEAEADDFETDTDLLEWGGGRLSIDEKSFLKTGLMFTSVAGYLSSIEGAIRFRLITFLLLTEIRTEQKFAYRVQIKVGFVLRNVIDHSFEFFCVKQHLSLWKLNICVFGSWSQTST